MPKEEIKVSDCHHGGLRETQVKNEETGKLEPSGRYICNVCNRPCRPLNMLVEEK